MVGLRGIRHLSRKIVAVLLVLSIALLIGVPAVGHLPVHRTNLIHSDPQGDVADSDFDIIRVESYRSSLYVILELTVAGIIQTPDMESPYLDYLYRINVVARGVNTDPHIYSCVYKNGIIKQYGFDVEVENSTLRIFFHLSGFVHDSYMIGLEGTAHYSFDQDLTSSDRASPLARILF